MLIQAHKILNLTFLKHMKNEHKHNFVVYGFEQTSCFKNAAMVDADIMYKKSTQLSSSSLTKLSRSTAWKLFLSSQIDVAPTVPQITDALVLLMHPL